MVEFTKFLTIYKQESKSLFIHRKAILQFDKNDNFIKEYEFLSEVKKDGFHIGNVASAARGELKSACGFIWKYKE
jgi:hypothetical protein